MSDSSNSPALEARVESLTAELHRLHTHTAAREAVRTAVPTATPDDLEVLVPQVASRLRAADDPRRPGTFVITVRDPDDPSRARTDDRGRPLSVTDVVDELRAHPTWSRLFTTPTPEKSAAADASLITLTEAEAKSPATYQRLKAQKARGEIAGAVDHRGRRFL
ncbi:hypothetical protein [Gemmatimonas sp.]|uniref:hypothetical protein n=1 Tax=Gemmatimonas sp. TaxID=1962908 RepID=UPI003DA4F70C